MSELDWTELDQLAVDTARLLAADAVQNVGNGHPGTAMSLAPAAYLLFQKVMRLDPTDPEWVGRDRFVLSCGHSSLTLYTQLFLGGFGLELEDLKSLRTWGSLTPGHPEYRHTPGVETTTGPLGQGIANAVGMAMAARRERGLFDPDAPADESAFDHHIYCLASEGDIQEGVSGEASSLAGTQRLGNLTLIYDENHISIEDNTSIAFTEDVAERYAAYGWHVADVSWRTPNGYVEDVHALYAAIAEARTVTDRPSLIRLRTIIGWPAPNLQDTGKAHGAALGDAEIAATKTILGFDPDQTFHVSDDVLSHARALRDRGSAAHRTWQESFDTWRENHPQAAELFARLTAGRLPEGWSDSLPHWDPDPKGIATRAASGKVLSALAPKLPELWGGSADLAGSNNTTPAGEPSFLPTDRSSQMFSGTPYGRVLHFGIREHAMGAIANGIVQHGPTRPYVGTFFVFSDYMRAAVRLAALMRLPAIYVWTHDSIGVGEDGPTHQPIEHLAANRAIPGLDVVRPADANETVAAWVHTISHTDRPTTLVLSRQNLPVLDNTSADGVAKGAYVLSSDADPDVILMATGSEVQLAVEAANTLRGDGKRVRVVSIPCREWFDEQDDAYRDEVLPPNVTARVVVEAGIAQGWADLLGNAGQFVGLDHYGASASGEVLYQKFGLVPSAVVDAAHRAIDAAASCCLVNRRAAAGPAQLGV